MKKILLALLLATLFSCNFQVIYEERSDVVSYAEELSAIRIKKDRTRIGQELKNNLYDILNPDYLKSEPKYFLTLKITTTTSSTFTTSTGASGRNRSNMDVAYELFNLDTGVMISNGSTSVNDSYDVTTKRFGTYVADEYIQTNLTKIAAQNIRNSLVNDFIEAKKKCEKAKAGELGEKGEEITCPLDGKAEEKVEKPENKLQSKSLKKR